VIKKVGFISPVILAARSITEIKSLIDSVWLDEESRWTFRQQLRSAGEDLMRLKKLLNTVQLEIVNRKAKHNGQELN